MRRPSRRISRLLGFTVVPVSLVATGLFVTASSYSVFNATTTNPTNAWNAGSLSLTDDDGGNSPTTGTAMFNVSNLKPGQSGSRCIVVTYTGSSTTLAPTVRLYGANYNTASSPNLGAQLNIKIEQGTGTTAASYANSAGGCTGFTAASTIFDNPLSTFNSTANSWTSAGTSNLTTWSPSATTDTRVYKFTWTFNSTGTPTGDNAYQGKGTGIDFVWEAQNT